MTIAISMRGLDGIVLGADTEENLSGIARTNCCKTQHFITNSGNQLALTGAGDSDYLDAIFQQIGNDFLSNQRTKEKDVESDIRKILMEFYKLHVLPFLRLPADERPDIELLIGGQINGLRIWKTYRNAISSVAESAAVGCGSYMARILFERLYGSRQFVPVSNLKYLAAYILYFVKKFVPGCGGGSNVDCIYQDGRMETLTKIPECEAVFRDLDHWTSLQTLFVTGAASDEKDVSKALSDLKNELVKLHKRLR